jgi:hypothetical protein
MCYMYCRTTLPYDDTLITILILYLGRPHFTS